MNDEAYEDGEVDGEALRWLSQPSHYLTSEREATRRRKLAEMYRRRYLRNLKLAGLELELVRFLVFIFEWISLLKVSCGKKDVVKSDKKYVKFVKVHIPWELLMTYAEELNFQVPINVIPIPSSL